MMLCPDQAKATPHDFLDQSGDAHFAFDIHNLPADDAAGMRGPALKRLAQPVATCWAGKDRGLHFPKIEDVE